MNNILGWSYIGEGEKERRSIVRYRVECYPMTKCKNPENTQKGNINAFTNIIIQPSAFFFFFFFFHLTYSRWTSSLPSCLWSQRIFPSLPGSRLTIFLSRCKFSTLTTRQPMVEFYLLTFPRFPLRKKEHKSYLGKNRTHDFRTSRCAAYLLDHSGDVEQPNPHAIATFGSVASHVCEVVYFRPPYDLLRASTRR